ncbi:MAG TPA: amino acid ABC transporter permease [Alphaproteobacteria bacterium]|nr:amino acid ABC transporter permease [Alphaproteobacteria bacterium]HIC72068.1 amino acid ABC transporter permease [Alphaproteobacteria bacterium]HIN91639.1 amino acid ABC transporter permease [Alphaproteobacteria bacterium]
MDYHFSFPVISEYIWVLLRGLATTLEFTVICILLGVALAFFICLLRISRFRVLRIISTAYVEFFRCTPVLIQLFWIFFCLPIIIGVEINNFASAVIALTLFMGAIGSETFRSAIQGISRDQLDTGVALGLSTTQRIRYILFPQAIRISIPTLLSNCVSLFKESALVSTVGMSDLMYVGQNVSNTTARPVEILTTVALLYFIVAFPLTRLVSLVERRLANKIGG